MNAVTQTALTFLRNVQREMLSAASQGAAYTNWADEFARKEISAVWKDSADAMRKARNRRITLTELAAMTEEELYSLGCSWWDGTLMVVPLWMYNYIADGEEFSCIDKTKAIKGKDTIDLDVRGGCIAFGFIKERQS